MGREAEKSTVCRKLVSSDVVTADIESVRLFVVKCSTDTSLTVHKQRTMASQWHISCCPRLLTYFSRLAYQLWHILHLFARTTLTKFMNSAVEQRVSDIVSSTLTCGTVTILHEVPLDLITSNL